MRGMYVCMYGLYVCMVCMYGLYVWFVCMVYMYGLYVCMVCMYGLYVRYACMYVRTASDWAQKEKVDSKKREAEIAKWKKRFEGMFIEIEVCR